MSDTKIGTLVDKLYSLRQERFKLQRRVDELKKEESEIQEYLISEIPKSNSIGVSGHQARVQIVKKQVPTVTDWDSLYAYISSTENYQLLQRRLNTAAYTELIESGEELKGVGLTQIVNLSINKI